jgi:hypothetical protein
MSEAAVSPIAWPSTRAQMVEAVLRAQSSRLAASYRNRLPELLSADQVQPAGKAVKTTSFPQLASLIATKIASLLQRLAPVRDEFTWTTASNAIDRALTLRDILAKGSDQHASWTSFSGAEVRRLMRLYDVSIVELARRLQATQKRVRHVRAHGVQGNAYCRDWYEAITQTGLFAPK